MRNPHAQRPKYDRDRSCGDYGVEAMVETPVVRALGGEVVAVAPVEGCSTTNIIERLRDE